MSILLRCLAVGFSVELLGLLSASAVEQQQLTAGPIPRIVNGLTTHAYPAVGAMLRGDLAAASEHLPINADTANQWCSGALIGCRIFLIAGHCVNNLAPDEAWVYLQHAGLFAVTSFVRRPDFFAPAADVAVLKLDAQVSGLAPAAINLTDPLPFIPAAGTVSVDQLVKGVNIALGNALPSTCAAFDRDGNRRVTVEELVQAVNAALTGCGG